MFLRSISFSKIVFATYFLERDFSLYICGLIPTAAFLLKPFFLLKPPPFLDGSSICYGTRFQGIDSIWHDFSFVVSMGRSLYTMLQCKEFFFFPFIIVACIHV
jgi:hypothetical protein